MGVCFLIINPFVLVRGSDDDSEDLLLLQFLILEPGLGGQFGNFAERFGADAAMNVQVGAGLTRLEQPEARGVSIWFGGEGDVQFLAGMCHQLFNHGTPEHGIREQGDGLVRGNILDEAFEGISG